MSDNEYKVLCEKLVKAAKNMRGAQERYGKNRSFCRQDYILKQQAERELDTLVKKAETTLNNTQTAIF